MRAADNPFRASRVNALSFRAEHTRAKVLARAAAHRYRGALVGPEGSGKSTLLSELGDDLEGSGVEVERLSCNERGWLTRLLRTPATVVLLDAAERVPAPLLVALVMLRRGGLMLTLHRQTSGIPVLTKCSVTVELLSSLVDELTGGDEPTRARAIALLGPKRGNVREILGALYEIAKDSA